MLRSAESQLLGGSLGCGIDFLDFHEILCAAVDQYHSNHSCLHENFVDFGRKYFHQSILVCWVLVCWELMCWNNEVVFDFDGADEENLDTLLGLPYVFEDTEVDFHPDYVQDLVYHMMLMELTDDVGSAGCIFDWIQIDFEKNFLGLHKMNFHFVTDYRIVDTVVDVVVDQRWKDHVHYSSHNLLDFQKSSQHSKNCFDFESSALGKSCHNSFEN